MAKLIIDKEITANLRGAVPETLFSIILLCMRVVRDHTGQDYKEITNRLKLDHKTADAAHMAALLIYEETVTAPISQRAISTLFGRSSQSLVKRAIEKEKELRNFADNMRVIRRKYQEASLKVYDKEIPF